MSKNKLPFDTTLLILVSILVVFGIVMVYSASSFKAQQATGDSHHYLENHLIKVGLSFLIMLVAMQIDYRFWLKISPYLLLLSLLALLILFTPLVEAIRGSRRWIVFGALRFQPSDFARIALILFLSQWLGKLDLRKKGSENVFLKTLAVIGVIVVPVMLQPDIGTAGLMVVIALTLIFLAGERLRHLLFLGMASIPVFILILKHNEYQRNRLLQYVSSIKGEEISWQIQQSLIALGNGSFFGIGLGSGRQKYHFLPDPYTDFIYSIVGEELGIIGTLGILILFLLLIWRGFNIAMQAPGRQARLLAIGIVLNIAVYLIANAGVVTNLLPTTGIPMPLISYGGSAMMATLFAMGVLLNISSQIKQSRSFHPVNNAYRRGGHFKRYGSS
ncbi:MAG: putative lipid II flippase FtsW [bacterium]